VLQDGQACQELGALGTLLLGLPYIWPGPLGMQYFRRHCQEESWQCLMLGAFAGRKWCFFVRRGGGLEWKTGVSATSCLSSVWQGLCNVEMCI